MLLVTTIYRNHIYQNLLNLWTDAAAKSPHKARPLNDVGLALTRLGRLEETPDEDRRN